MLVKVLRVTANEALHDYSAARHFAMVVPAWAELCQHIEIQAKYRFG